MNFWYKSRYYYLLERRYSLDPDRTYKVKRDLFLLLYLLKVEVRDETLG